MRICDITGKKAYVANNVSHAQNRTKKRQQPNLQEKRIWVPEAGKFAKLTLSTRAIRTINKIGLKQLCKNHGIDYASVIELAQSV